MSSSYQAVRCAIQEIIRAGQRYSGVFGQVKLVHEFVGKKTKFSKKQVRWGRSEVRAGAKVERC